MTKFEESQELQILKKYLREIEYVEKTDTNFIRLIFCPACGEDKNRYDHTTGVWEDNPHKPDCWLKKAIDN